MTICIFHANCADGFGAAWVVRKALGDIEFHPGKYQEPPPDVTGKDVVMVDFSYKRPVLLEMAEKANSILILDHHLSAMNDIGPLPKSVRVPLSNGAAACVDESDLPLVSGYSWSEHVRGGAVAYTGGGRADAKTAYMHHLILKPRDGLVVDHINRNSLDNRRANLRYATKQQNGANMDRGNGYKGVSHRGDRFLAQITVDGNNRYLGMFDTEEAAALAYDTAAKEAWGEYARLNFGQSEPFPPNCHFVFDMEHSGAMLTWEHFFPGETPPKLLQHIQDRDLWLFHLDATREICAALYSHPFDFALFNLWCNSDQLHGMAADGAAIERKNAKDLVELLDSNTRFIMFAGHDVPSANLPPYLASAAGDELSKAHSFAIIWHDTRDGVRVSLRSQREGGLDVSQIAKIYGGGGHRNAAGFTVSRDLAYQLGITR